MPVSRWFVWVIGFVLVAGWVFTEWKGQLEDASQRRDILTQARIASKSIDIPGLRTLAGSPNGLTSPGYLHIKGHLMGIRSANPLFRFVYLMGKKDKAVFFFVDSELPDSKDYSPPGQPYESSSDEFMQIFDTGDEITEGPLNDEWGTWISLSIPIKDPRLGKVLAVLGVDIDASGYIKFINPACERLIGYTTEECVGKHYLDFVPPEFHKEFARATGRQFVKKIPGTGTALRLPVYRPGHAE